MNWLKNKIKKQNITKGLWLSSGSTIVAEISGNAGFDWALIDLEHGLGGEQEALTMLQALNGSPTSPIVRVPVYNSPLIKRMLDFGASAIMAPMTNTKEEAEEFVNQLKYPPEGIRGMTASSRASTYGKNFSKYYKEANKKVTSIVQIETAEAIKNINEIAAVPGVDVIFIGHSDLSLSLGCFSNLNNSQIQDAENKVIQACKQNNKVAGMLLKSSMSQSEYLKKGFSFFGLGSDLGCLKTGMQQLLK